MRGAPTGAPASSAAGEPAADLEAVAAAPAGLDGAARRGDDVLHDREAEPGAARGPRLVGPVEALEEPRQVALADADAVVGGGEHGVVTVALDGQRERRPVPGVPDRVLGEVLRQHSQ